MLVYILSYSRQRSASLEWVASKIYLVNSSIWTALKWKRGVLKFLKAFPSKVLDPRLLSLGGASRRRKIAGCDGSSRHLCIPQNLHFRDQISETAVELRDPNNRPGAPDGRIADCGGTLSPLVLGVQTKDG